MLISFYIAKKIFTLASISLEFYFNYIILQPNIFGQQHRKQIDHSSNQSNSVKSVIDVLSTALRVICKPEDLEGGFENVEYNLAFVDILSVGGKNKAIFLDIFEV